MAAIIFTIGMRVAWFFALMAITDDLIPYPFPSLSSNTKFFPLNLLGRPSFFTVLA